MKVLILSDLSLEVIHRNQLRDSQYNYSFIFCEDLVLELKTFDRYSDFDIFYVHFDGYFKKYNTDYLISLINAIDEFVAKTGKFVFCSNLFDIGWSDFSMKKSISSILNYDDVLNSAIKELNGYSTFFFFDVLELITQFGRENVYKYELGHVYQIPYSKRFLDIFTKTIESFIAKISAPDKKVLVLDCDNTLWKGVVGEDGLNGIECDLSPDGILFYHFQQFILSRKQIGFILCLCSKNNEADVHEVFTNKRMPLNWDDFIIKKVNWENKDQNIIEIAEELSLGLDSFVFIDDSDFELNIVRENLPEVQVVKLVDNYQDFINITRINCFRKKLITAEDYHKSDHYLTEVKRKNLEKKTNSFEDYISSLELALEVREDEVSDLNRVSQLTQKTNQFNFNKVFYSTEELAVKITSGVFKIYTLRVTDKFGDYGLVGVIIFRMNNGIFTMENYILSCRVLGRRIEFDFLEKVKLILLEKYASPIHEINFKETTRNIPAQKFYQKIITII
jgi:FkbH-like protein